MTKPSPPHSVDSDARTLSDGELSVGTDSSAVTTADDLDGDLRDALGMRSRRAGPALTRGMVIDAYEIDQEIGVGGMGRVYRARDLRLGRDVAIKLLLAISVEPDGDRLRREATALARLSHPHVVTVYEIGTWGEHPWVAMEYVPGGTARTWVGAERRTDREILALYVAAGRGLEAAHAAGLVHRDFKPDNVLVGRDGQIRVADFGLACDHDSAERTAPQRDATSSATPGGAPSLPSVTRTGVVLGTPAYMAPEQRLGDAGPAADQFAFAISLWEALSGARPFAGTTETEIAEAIFCNRIRPPVVPLDKRLERALRRALEVDPAARWPSMTALLCELARDRAATRRKATVAAVIVASVGIAMAGIAAIASRGATVLCAELATDTIWTAQRREAVRGTLSARAESEDAARVIVGIDDWVAAWRDQRVGACAATHERATQSPELLDLRNFCLDRAGAELEAALGSLERLSPGEIDRAPELVRGLPRLDDCADVPRLSGQTPPSDPVLDAALAAMIARVNASVIAGDSRVADARAAVAAIDPSIRPGLAAEAELALARALDAAGEIGGLLATYERAARHASFARDDVLVARAWIAALETVARRLEKPGEADRMLAVAEAAVARAGDRSELRAGLLRGRGDLLVFREQHRDAIAVFEQALAIEERAHGVDSDATRPLLHRLANGYLQLQDTDRARPLIDRARVITERYYGPRHREIGVLLTTRGQIELTAGNYGLARDLLDRALAHKERSFGPNHPALVPTLMNLAVALEGVNEIDAAKRATAHAIAIAETALDIGHPQVAHMYGVLAGLELHRADWAAAETALERAIALEEATGERVTLAYALIKLAHVYAHREDFEGGRTLLARALAIATKTEPETMAAAEAFETLGNLEISAARPAAATTAWRSAARMVEHLAGTNHPVFQRLQIELSTVAP